MSNIKICVDNLKNRINNIYDELEELIINIELIEELLDQKVKK